MQTQTDVIKPKHNFSLLSVRPLPRAKPDKMTRIWILSEVNERNKK